ARGNESFFHSIRHLLSDFLADCFFLRSKRSSIFARGILVGIRFFVGNSALSSRSTSLAKASSLLASWLRLSDEDNCKKPSACIRLDNLSSIRAFCSAENSCESRIFHTSVTLVSTLLTFCPPAPLEREVLKVTSFCKSSKSIAITQTLPIYCSTIKKPYLNLGV